MEKVGQVAEYCSSGGTAAVVKAHVGQGSLGPWNGRGKNEGHLEKPILLITPQRVNIWSHLFHSVLNPCHCFNSLKKEPLLSVLTE